MLIIAYPVLTCALHYKELNKYSKEWTMYKSSYHHKLSKPVFSVTLYYIYYTRVTLLEIYVILVHKLINVIQIKIPEDICGKSSIEALFVCKCKTLRYYSWTILMVKNKARLVTLPDITIYYRAKVIKTIWDWLRENLSN